MWNRRGVVEGGRRGRGAAWDLDEMQKGKRTDETRKGGGKERCCRRDACQQPSSSTCALETGGNWQRAMQKAGEKFDLLRREFQQMGIFCRFAAQGTCTRYRKGCGFRSSGWKDGVVHRRRWAAAHWLAGHRLMAMHCSGSFAWLQAVQVPDAFPLPSSPSCSSRRYLFLGQVSEATQANQSRSVCFALILPSVPIRLFHSFPAVACPAGRL